MLAATADVSADLASATIFVFPSPPQPPKNWP